MKNTYTTTDLKNDPRFCGNVGPGNRVCGRDVDNHNGPHTNVRQGVGRDQRKVWA